MADVSIVIVTYGKWAITERCLRSLTAALGDKIGQTWEIVVVDNHSPDETPEMLRKWPGPLSLELLEENRNFAGGCNAGARVASGRTLIFLNNDTEVPPGTLEALAEQLWEPGVGAVGCRLLYPNGTIQHAGVAFMQGFNPSLPPMPQHVFHHQDGDLAATEATFEADAVTAACVAVRRDAFVAVGGFEESYVNALEDIDLCLKLRAAGHRIVYRGDVTLIHHEGATRGKGVALFASPEQLHTMEANDALFGQRWGADLEPDDELAARVWGAQLRDRPPPDTRVVAANVLIAGSPSGIGPAADECRALLRAVVAIGQVPRAFDIPRANVVAPLSEAMAMLLDTTLRVSELSDARAVYVPSGPCDDLYLPRHRVVPDEHARVRLGWGRSALDLSSAGCVLVPSRTVAAQLQAGGLAAKQLRVMPPLVHSRHAGGGGSGLLVILPTHVPKLAAKIVDALKRVPVSVPVSLLPSAFRRDLATAVAASLPHAQLLGPCAGEERYAALAGSADVVLCADPSDPFERAALVAASVGTFPLTLWRDGPATEVLGTEVVAVEDALPDALLAALERPRSPRQLIDTVAVACDPRQIATVI